MAFVMQGKTRSATKHKRRQILYLVCQSYVFFLSARPSSCTSLACPTTSRHHFFLSAKCQTIYCPGGPRMPGGGPGGPRMPWGGIMPGGGPSPGGGPIPIPSGGPIPGGGIPMPGMGRGGGIIPPGSPGIPPGSPGIPPGSPGIPRPRPYACGCAIAATVIKYVTTRARHNTDVSRAFQCTQRRRRSGVCVCG